MPNTLEQLIALEQIKQLKYRYFRTLDCNEWEDFGQTLTEDCIGDYSSGALHFEGRDAIVEFMTNNMSSDQFLSMHTGHHPEITFHSNESASGIWYLQDMIVFLAGSRRLYGSAIYKDDYVKVDGQWLISKTGYERIFECIEPINEEHQVLQNRFTKPSS